jgi:hypothetical protein
MSPFATFDSIPKRNLKFPPLSADFLKQIHNGLQLLLYVQFENFRTFLKQKVTRPLCQNMADLAEIKIMLLAPAPKGH